MATQRKAAQRKRVRFIDDEAEESGDDPVSDDEDADAEQDAAADDEDDSDGTLREKKEKMGASVANIACCPFLCQLCLPSFDAPVPLCRQTTMEARWSLD
jgi:hypothetical protein